MPTARDLMTKNPVTLQVTATVKDALLILQSMEIRHLPIVNEQDELVGMVSDRDLRSLSIPRTFDERWLGELRVALREKIVSVMTADVLSVDVEADATEIIELMLEHKIGAVPVTDADGSLVGIVSYIDVLRELSALVVDAAQ
ncbi:MAG TPA: CBS domain-containing protein [Polyangiales bacterium]|nr:CBS domain-containing protein [Polyangiales bacterium]